MTTHVYCKAGKILSKLFTDVFHQTDKILDWTEGYDVTTLRRYDVAAAAAARLFVVIFRTMFRRSVSNSKTCFSSKSLSLGLRLRTSCAPKNVRVFLDHLEIQFPTRWR